jgi:hypothetical protein
VVRTLGPISFALLVFTFPLVANASDKASRAADKAACVDAYGKAQGLRDEHRLTSAREQLRICAQSSCTSFIARDCTAWLIDIESRIPSIVPVASDASGSDLSNVTVSMDGTIVTRELDGQSIDVDPGRHTFTFALPGGPQVDQSFLVVEGQKAQRVRATLPTPAATAMKVGSGATSATSAGGEAFGSQPPNDAGPSAWTRQKTLAVVAGGLGVVGIALGTVFGLEAIPLATKFNNECSNAQSCHPIYSQAVSDHGQAANDATISNAAFITGGALVALGVVLFVTSPVANDEAKAQTSARLQVAPSVLPGGGGAWLRGSF